MKKLSLCLFLLITCRSLIYAGDVIDTADAQAFQREFDEKYWEINEGFEKLRHIFLHLVKTTGKMAIYCDRGEHEKCEPDSFQLENEVLPDLLLHALQIANYFDIDLGEQYAERIQFLINRSDTSQKDVSPTIGG